MPRTKIAVLGETLAHNMKFSSSLQFFSAVKGPSEEGVGKVPAKARSLESPPQFFWGGDGYSKESRPLQAPPKERGLGSPPPKFFKSLGLKGGG